MSSDVAVVGQGTGVITVGRARDHPSSHEATRSWPSSIGSRRAGGAIDLVSIRKALIHSWNASDRSTGCWSDRPSATRPSARPTSISPTWTCSATWSTARRLGAPMTLEWRDRRRRSPYPGDRMLYPRARLPSRLLPSSLHDTVAAARRDGLQ